MAETDKNKEGNNEEKKAGEEEKEPEGVVGGIFRGVSDIIENILEIPGSIISKTFKKRK
ncbi:MAG: hypothetical protein ACE5I8_00370 [Thermodesulfobacteriota bacterium]